MTLSLPSETVARLPLFPESARISPAGHLLLGGVDVMTLAREVGTPLYVYDADEIRARCREYRAALAAAYPGPGQIAYASKAYLCTALARLMAEEGLGLDVVSGGELAVALRAGFPAARIHLHGNNKSLAELNLALETGVERIVVDNFDELALLRRLADARFQMTRRPTPIWLRLSPNVDVHTHAYRKTGLLDSKFGFALATGDADRAVDLASGEPLALMGIHAHIGSQIFEVQPFVETARALLEWAAARRLPLAEFSPGGGWGVRYTPDDPVAPLGDYVRAVGAAIAEQCAALGMPLPRVTLEPGRSLVARAGVALYTIGARKAIPDVRTYVSIDGGLADNSRPALYQAQYTALLANRAADPVSEPVTIAGKFCESGDILIRDLPLPPPEPGDLLAVPVSGAYHLAMASNYNQALRPAVVFVSAGRAWLVQRREQYDDLVRRDAYDMHIAEIKIFTRED